MTIATSNFGGGAYTKFPTIPAQLVNEGYLSSAGNRIPHGGSAVDNIEFPISYAPSVGFKGRLGWYDIWSVVPTDVTSAAAGLLGEATIWYDDVNDRLYFFVVDENTTPISLYTAYVTVETGVLTIVGSTQLTTTPDAYNVDGTVCVVRDNVASGAFTLYFSNRTIVLDSSTGAEVSNISVINIVGADQAPTSLYLGNYRTEEGTYLSSINNTELSIVKNKILFRIPLPVSNAFLSSGLGGVPIMWGGQVKIRSSQSTSGGRLRTYLKADFDAWVEKVAAYGGLG